MLHLKRQTKCARNEKKTIDSYVVLIQNKEEKTSFVLSLGFDANQSFKAVLFVTLQSSTKNVNEVEKELFVEIL